MNWQEVCSDLRLKDLPYKIELNEYGKILMSPQKVYHSAFQSALCHLLQNLLGAGRALSECAIATSKGTKVADVAWASPERFELIKHELECSVAPEICIEIVSASNSNKEMEEKRALYFAQGAEEFWLCSESGEMTFYDRRGRRDQSRIVPNFPVRMAL